MATVITKQRLDADMTRPEGHPTVSQDESVPDGLIGEIVEWFKLLADDTRLRIIYFLMHREELNVRTLCEMLGQSQPAVSHHLALLRVAGLIESRRDGKHNFYHLLPAKFEEMVRTIFRITPGGSARLQFERFVIECAPPDGTPS